MLTAGGLIALVVVLVILGLLVYLVDALPIAPPFKMAARVIAILAAILYLLQAFGLYRLP